jgi:hypothetical protein
MRWDTKNNRVYAAREFDEGGRPVRDVDFTSPTYPSGKPRPPTGPFGGGLVERTNRDGTIILSTEALLQLLCEDGQVLELDATMTKGQERLLRIIIRDGCSVDVLGASGEPKTDLLGPFVNVDPSLFLWDPRDE